MTFLAKPNDANMSNSMMFESMPAACEYLNEFTGVEPKMKVDEWIVLGKILEVTESGQTKMPDFYPKMVKGKIVMERVDIDSFL